MPLTKTDLKQIEKLLDIQSKTLRREINQSTTVQLKGLHKTINRDMGVRFKTFRKAINQDIGNFIISRILPQIDLLHDELENLNRRMDVVFDRGDRQNKKLDNHEVRITQLEQASL